MMEDEDFAPQIEAAKVALLERPPEADGQNGGSTSYVQRCPHRTQPAEGK